MRNDPMVRVATFFLRALKSAFKTRRRRLVLATLFAMMVTPWAMLFALAANAELPAQLRDNSVMDVSLVVRDRNGIVIDERRAKDGNRARFVPLRDMGERVPKAIVAAEDTRFWHHPGVDPFSIVRAGFQAIRHKKVVSGASTITQQLARTLVPRPKSAVGKINEMALAIRIESALSKEEILEQYCNRVVFGPGLRGIEAASRFYFDKPTKDLSLAETATLAGMPRGPSLYDPRKGTDRILFRRNTVLARMADAGIASDAEIERALAEPLTLSPRGSGLGAPHLVRALLSGKLPELGEAKGQVADLTLTLDRGLQQSIELMAQDVVAKNRRLRLSAASVLVLENASGNVLAYVGSHNFDDVEGQGQNDGVLAKRQPGSSLKPFVYGLAMERLGFTAATMIADVETHFVTNDGTFTPGNYDGRFHGPVLLRQALANSYNVPAVRTADAIGPDLILARLRDLGFLTLDRSAEEYGPAIALGDGETRLLDLANAYATLARGGTWLPVRTIQRASFANGSEVPITYAKERNVLDPAITHVLIDILSDDGARAAAFGRGSALSFPFPVAAKTGTSKGFRDNIAVGFTTDVTVAVWTGNFDGSPMDGVSGVSGAGPLFHDVMLAAQTYSSKEHPTGGPPRSQARLPASSENKSGTPLIETANICPLSGALQGPFCPHGVIELFPTAGLARRPHHMCDQHISVSIDRRNGLLAGKNCSSAFKEERIFERYPPDLTGWAKAEKRPLAPSLYSPLCPASPSELSAGSAGRPALSYPPSGAMFVLDPHLGVKPSIVLRADGDIGPDLIFKVDGRSFRPKTGEVSMEWPLTLGAHQIWVESFNKRSATSDIVVTTE